MRDENGVGLERTPNYTEVPTAKITKLNRIGPKYASKSVP